MTSTDEERLAKLTRKRLHADFKAGRARQQRRKQQRREAEAHRGGSQGPAGPCRRIDPVTGEVLGEIVAAKARGIAPAAPLIGAPALGIVPAGTVRQRRKRQLDALDRRPVRATPKYYALCEALIRSERLSEAEALDEGRIAACVTGIVDEWARRWLSS